MGPKLGVVARFAERFAVLLPFCKMICRSTEQIKALTKVNIIQNSYCYQINLIKPLQLSHH